MDVSLTESEQKRVDEISEKVTRNKGQIIFCSRGIQVPGAFTGDFIPPIPGTYYPYEAGIISGKIDFPDNPPNKSINLIDRLEIMPGRGTNYSYEGFLSVPIHRKMSGFIYQYNRIQFDIECLEKLTDGHIFAGLNELPYEEFEKRRLIKELYDSDRAPKLENFRLLIGDDEVLSFLIEGRIANWKEFTDILKNPEEVERRIHEHYDKKKKGLAEDILLAGQELNTSRKKIIHIEKKVLNAHLYREMGQDGSCLTWGEETGAVNQYYNLRGGVNILISNLEKLTEKYDEVKLESIPEIRGEVIGFPGGVSPKDYFVWVNTLVLQIKEEISRINLHLNGEKKKVE